MEKFLKQKCIFDFRHHLTKITETREQSLRDQIYIKTKRSTEHFPTAVHSGLHMLMWYKSDCLQITC